MTDTYFPVPMNIRSGADSSRRIATLQDAVNVLVDWPQAKRGEFYRAAREAIDGAVKGKVTPAQAQEMFAAFCNHTGILVL